MSCKQPETKIVARAPRADEWVDSVPTLDGQDKARLSETAVAWIRDLLGIVDKEREYRGIEHRCLDEHERKGDILQ